MNAYLDIPVSIWYDWLDDGTDQTLGENNFGTVHNHYNNASLPRTPKLAYYAARTLTGLAHDLPVKARYPAMNITSSGTQNDNDTYALSFDKGNDEEVIAVWKVGAIRKTLLFSDGGRLIL